MTGAVVLTSRRQDFLRKLWEIYAAKGEPVHYAEVAEALGVSKWTAYDMLKELEKDGYVVSEYILSGGKRPADSKIPGRSMVAFIPMELSIDIGEGMTTATLPGEVHNSREDSMGDGEAIEGWALRGRKAVTEDWGSIKSRLFDLFDNIRKVGAKRAIEQLIREASIIEFPLGFCAYVIAILVICFKAVSTRAIIGTIMKLVVLATEPQIALGVFAGLALGIIMKAAGKWNFVRRLAEYVARYQRYIGEISLEERKLLLDFLKEALEVVS